MTLPDLKELDKLIQLCRKRGIKTVKMGELELTLSEEAPAKPSRKAAKNGFTASVESASGEPEVFDALSDEEKLFWSTGAGIPGSPDEQEGS